MMRRESEFEPLPLPANHKITRQVQVKDKEEEVGTSTRSQCDFEQNIHVLWDDFEMMIPKIQEMLPAISKLHFVPPKFGRLPAGSSEFA